MLRLTRIVQRARCFSRVTQNLSYKKPANTVRLGNRTREKRKLRRQAEKVEKDDVTLQISVTNPPCMYAVVKLTCSH